ncbi:MAG: copper chaperone PCu(A)C [Melioribacter sp.]|nr:copper chaperone PCu(A)C [Melioribacter sp.]
MFKKILIVAFILELTFVNKIFSQSITIKDSWARPASKGRNSAAYFTIINKNSFGDSLVQAISNIAEKVEIHETFKTENDMMGMRAIKFISIPANSEVKLKPGGLHIMLIGLKKNITEKDSVNLKLKFKRAKEIDIKIPVKDIMKKMPH